MFIKITSEFAFSRLNSKPKPMYNVKSTEMFSSIYQPDMENSIEQIIISQPYIQLAVATIYYYQRFYSLEYSYSFNVPRSFSNKEINMLSQISDSITIAYDNSYSLYVQLQGITGIAYQIFEKMLYMGKINQYLYHFVFYNISASLQHIEDGFFLYSDNDNVQIDRLVIDDEFNKFREDSFIKYLTDDSDYRQLNYGIHVDNFSLDELGSDKYVLYLSRLVDDMLLFSFTSGSVHTQQLKIQ